MKGHSRIEKECNEIEGRQRRGHSGRGGGKRRGVVGYKGEKVGVKLTTRKVLHNEVQVGCVLEGIVHLDNPLVVSLNQNVALGSHVCHLLLLQHVAFPQNLHGKHVTRVALLHQSHLRINQPEQYVR